MRFKFWQKKPFQPWDCLKAFAMLHGFDPKDVYEVHATPESATFVLFERDAEGYIIAEGDEAKTRLVSVRR